MSVQHVTDSRHPLDVGGHPRRDVLQHHRPHRLPRRGDSWLLLLPPVQRPPTAPATTAAATRRFGLALPDDPPHQLLGNGGATGEPPPAAAKQAQQRQPLVLARRREGRHTQPAPPLRQAVYAFVNDIRIGPLARQPEREGRPQGGPASSNLRPGAQHIIWRRIGGHDILGVP
ncbi:hypothetical protein [Streptomyces griseosporeus]|uniref:hypothetical protein n=1 Tax=Streptomyces griseosporeus TaxID=1910 RepID=UPI0037A3AD2F